MTQWSDIRARFLAAIATQVTVESVAEAHLFQPIKQGGFESGVAVVAVSHESNESHESYESNEFNESHESNESNESNESHESHEFPESDESPDVPDAGRSVRLVVYTAKYRLTLKGPDRGKWDFSMNAEADAPLVTVDAVVRGVQKRSGDMEEPEKLTGDEFRTLLAKGPETPTPATPSPS